MRVILQRCSEASVKINQEIVGAIDHGFVLLLGIENEDTDQDINWLVEKIIKLRVFQDLDNKMNESILDHQGSFLVISQFTLFASTKKGNRPSFIRSAKPDIAVPLYEKFIETLKIKSGLTVETGKFGADMKVQLVNDGPVTISIDSKNKE